MPGNRQKIGVQGLQIGEVPVFEAKDDPQTVKDILQHLIDAERVFAYRALRFARNDKTELHGFEEVPDMGARLAADDITQPGRIRLGVRGGDDFDAIAISQFRTQRHQFVIDLGSHAAVADVSMHRVSKIDTCGTVWQGQDLALGRKDVDFVRK